MSVTVVGSLNEDVLVAVGPVAGPRGDRDRALRSSCAPGGKGANQAAAAGRLGPGVHMVGRVGADAAGDRQLAALADAGVNVGRVQRTPGVPTGTATIPVEDGSGENLIVVVPGANGQLRPDDVDVESVPRAGVLLLQLEVPLETVTAAAAAARGTVVLTPAPPQPLPAELLAHVDVLVPNEHELAAPGRRRRRGAVTGGARRARPRCRVLRGRGHPGRPRRAGRAGRRRAGAAPGAAAGHRRRHHRRRRLLLRRAGAGPGRRRRRSPTPCATPSRRRRCPPPVPARAGRCPDDDAVRALLPQVPHATEVG